MSLDQAPRVAPGDEVGDGPVGAAAPRTRGRVDRQPRRRRRGRMGRRVLYVLGAALAAGAVWWVGWASPVTLVQHVVVDSPKGISEKAVRKASGIAATDHVPGVDAALVRDNIMRALPAVAAVEVHRSLPDTVSLTVTARKPFAAIPRGATFVVIDATGVEFDEVSTPGKLPVIRAMLADGAIAARDVLAALPEDLRADVRTVTATTHHDVDLTLSSGAIVRWGSPEESELKVRVLEGLRAVKARHYDVSAPMMPTTSG